MRKIIAAVLLCGVFTAVFAEEAQPQIAFRILSDHLNSEKSHGDAKIGGAITMGVGLTLTFAGVGAFVWGDDISAALNHGVPWESTTKYIVSGSLFGTGLVTTGIGAAIFFSVPKDPFLPYSAIFAEKDPVVQEALAAAALRNLYEEGKEQRIRSGFLNLTVPIATLGITVGLNLVRGRQWYSDLTAVGSWQLWSIFGGISQLFFEKSKGEKIYEKYLAARDTIFASDD